MNNNKLTYEEYAKRCGCGAENIRKRIKNGIIRPELMKIIKRGKSGDSYHYKTVIDVVKFPPVQYRSKN